MIYNDYRNSFRFVYPSIAFKYQKVSGVIKGLCDPWPIWAPINVIGDVAVPISLSLRLFANVLSGTVMHRQNIIMTAMTIKRHTCVVVIHSFCPKSSYWNTPPLLKEM